MSNYSQDTVNMQEIIELVNLLRQNGDMILSASSKLSLSTKLLHSLNEAFSLIILEPEDLESSFQVCNSSKVDIFRDIKFLHDFVQKTISLKITHYSSDDVITIDISKFRHLKYLELKKVSIELMKGLQSVRGQLESIVCAGRKGVSTICQLLATCGGDAGIGFVWASLRHLVLSHNALECLDESLELAPWLQILDLNHNMITSAKEISCLSALKYVNLGYNKLKEVPTFNKLALYSLQILVLKNNYIDNLNGLQGLECLTELDLSFNCLMDHSVLWPLQQMSTLLWLSLEGNPLSYHPKHRLLSIKHLHPSLSDSKFVLDRLPLSKLEKTFVIENRVFTIRANQSISLTSSMSTCVDTYEFNENGSNRITLSDNLERSITRSKKKSNMREAIIDEIDQEKGEFKKLPDVVASSHLESSKDHLEIKKRILDLREKFGENNWLNSHAGTSVQDIMGLHCEQFTTSQMFKTLADINTSTSLHNNLIHTMFNEKFSSEPQSEEIAKYTEDDKDIPQNEEIVDEIHTLETHTTHSTTVYDSNETEEAGDLYIVQKRKSDSEMETIFLMITPENIKEKDTITGKVKFHWSMSSILSCVLGKNDPPTIDIIFDTTRKDKENRRYFVQLEDAKKIVTIINEQIEMRPIPLQVFKCMKCSTQFSQDMEYVMLAAKSMTGSKQLKCPICDSSLVIEIENPSGLDNQTVKNQSAENSTRINLQHSESFSSIGSATSLEESRESTPSTNALTKKYESDIEILSNPSQSSIEVLDETLKTNVTPSRKQEERRTAIAPSLITIPDATPVMAALTESSSSGSLADSICTAYENKIAKLTNDTKSQSSEKEIVPVTNLTSMLGSLLQSIKIGGNKILRGEEASSFFGSDVQYSYTNFNSIDHRIKLHIILNILEHENEEVVFLLKAQILMPSMQEIFSGCLVLSTSKVYILRIDGPEGEDPQRWLHKEISWTTDRLRSFVSLPFKQGILIELQQPGKINEELSSIITVLCILQDFQRTSNFLFYITDLRLPSNCEVEFSVPECFSLLMNDLLMNTVNYKTGDVVRLLAIFSSAVIKYQNVIIKFKLSGLILTNAILIILEDNVQWLMPGSDQVPLIAREQTMSNLIAIEHYNNSLTLNFLDEIAGLEESWVLEFVSLNAVEAVINSIQPSWEELFSIPLQVTTTSNSRVMQSNEDA
ncbi:serine/threonine-protein kinase 11-interacting protein isoform X2 [Camponotus floridanus]|uniref:serine/threonine-protein kinase 11-interacting protein isoform X2 n=1 Tax=Camponotus floridanus TaxID=104421 RepID=UPI00059C6F98|nr:serine/threonine-protein kinase 11-interacting protein isoform X2 [Camponotus floridanus]